MKEGIGNIQKVKGKENDLMNVLLNMIAKVINIQMNNLVDNIMKKREEEKVLLDKGSMKILTKN